MMMMMMMMMNSTATPRLYFCPILFLPPTLLTACPAPPRIGSGRVLRLSSSECPPRWTAPTETVGIQMQSQVSFLLRKKTKTPKTQQRARVSLVLDGSSMTADLSRIPHHHHRRHHHRFVLVLARGKRLSVFSARRSDERGIIRVRRGESCQRRHPRAIRAPNTPRPFPESEVTPFFFLLFPG